MVAPGQMELMAGAQDGVCRSEQTPVFEQLVSLSINGSLHHIGVVVEPYTVQSRPIERAGAWVSR